MIQKQLTQLDPKLKEAYERVMGTGLPQTKPAAQTLPIQTKPTPAPNPSVTDQTNISESYTPKVTSSFTASSSNTPVSNQAKEETKVNIEPQKGGGKIPPVLIIFGVIVLLAIYTFVWTKIFNLSIPFLPF